MLPPMTRPVFLTLVIGLLAIGTMLNILSMLHTRHGIQEYSSFDLQTQGESREFPERINDAVLRFDFGNYSITSDDQWASLFPPHGGQVLLDGIIYDVSLYLQLKCLDTVRVAFVTLRDAFNGSDSPAHAIDSVDFKETEYCLDVLRQTVVCIADITLEPGEVVVLPDGSTDMAATGNHVEHVCKDWVQVREFVETNQESWNR